MTKIPDLATDSAGFHAAVQQAAERGRRIAALRPGWKQVGGELAKLHIAFVSSLWGTGAASRASERPLKPLPNSLGDSVGTPGINDENNFMLTTAHTYVTGVRDHLEALSILAVAGASPRSILAMCRIVLDASAHTAFLLDASVDETTRLSRAINIELESLRQENGDPQVGDVQSETATSRREDLMQSAVEAGFVRSIGKKGPEWKVMPVVATGDALTHVLGERANLPWRYLSSAAHVQERPVVRFGTGLDALSAGPHSPSFTITQGLVSVAAAIQAVRAAEDYYGTVQGPVPHDVANRVMAVGAFGAGLQDEKLATKLQ